MIRFPVFRKFTLTNYEMFPQKSEDEPHTIVFERGPTLIAGINGLGKTTLITMLLRSLTGPYDLSRRGGIEQLGEISTVPVKLGNPGIFRSRVADGAENAFASLSCSFGREKVLIKRHLKNLSLQKFSIGGIEFDVEDEPEGYQREIARLVGVSSFFDVILILRHLVFYLEDRRELVWDPTAQRQLLRLLFLDPDDAFKWSELTQHIKSVDSSARSLNTIINREEKRLQEARIDLKYVSDVRAEITALKAAQKAALEQSNSTEEELESVERDKEDARLRLLRAQMHCDEALRELERLKMRAVESHFPSASDTARYLLTHLLAQESCAACGAEHPKILDVYQGRLAKGDCVICGSPPEKQKNVVHKARVERKRIEKLRNTLSINEEQVRTAKADLNELEARRTQILQQLEPLNVEIRKRSSKIRVLTQKLPPDEREVSKDEEHLEAFRERYKEYLKERKIAENKFSALLEIGNSEVLAKHKAISRAFDKIATNFLVEKCHLTFEPHKARIGQSGEVFEFAAFSLEMTSGAIPTPTLRRGPDDVSESQREFIDIAFRMALMAVAARSAATTIVIDAPESSLDIVFAKRAGILLAGFSNSGRPPGNRLIVSTNLATSGLIPALIDKIPRGAERWERTVSLLDIAVPNAAAREHWEEYSSFLVEVLGDRSQGSKK